ncbi:MAG: glyoxalase superfamily protein [Verrucomicrobiota bacterium]|nr:glyoxalase superfamily protein [Verrucomicrobiota bacterium]
MPDPPVTKKPASVIFEGTKPILAVRDLAASIAYYTGALGFEVDWEQPGILASVSRGRCNLFLSEGDQGHPGTWLWIGVSDVDALFQEYVANGATIRHPPTNYPWAYEMQVEDLDGHVLRFGADSKEGQPIGEWLDMKGAHWTETAEGRWSKVT